MPLLFLSMLCWLAQFFLDPGKALAQQLPASAPPVAPGQIVPDVSLSGMIHHPTSTARLSDFQGKLLLLDFWATWCGSCKAALPKLDAIQAEFGDKVQVLLVSSSATGDTEEKVNAYFERWRRPDGSRYPMAATVDGTELNRLFPHRLIPHLVWIAPDGTLHAITGPEALTPENVRAALKTGRKKPGKSY